MVSTSLREALASASVRRSEESTHGRHAELSPVGGQRATGNLFFVSKGVQGGSPQDPPAIGDKEFSPLLGLLEADECGTADSALSDHLVVHTYEELAARRLVHGLVHGVLAADHGAPRDRVEGVEARLKPEILPHALKPLRPIKQTNFSEIRPWLLFVLVLVPSCHLRVAAPEKGERARSMAGCGVLRHLRLPGGLEPLKHHSSVLLKLGEQHFFVGREEGSLLLGSLDVGGAVHEGGKLGELLAGELGLLGLRARGRESLDEGGVQVRAQVGDISYLEVRDGGTPDGLGAGLHEGLGSLALVGLVGVLDVLGEHRFRAHEQGAGKFPQIERCRFNKATVYSRACGIVPRHTAALPVKNAGGCLDA